jgi:hypothetical protein
LAQGTRKIDFCNCRMRLLKPPIQTANEPTGACHKTEKILMKRNLLFLLAFTSFAIALPASPTPAPNPKHASNKNEKKSGGQKAISEEIALSANGWSYANNEWVHPEGYKFVNGKVLRTTARAGKAFPRPPGRLALENAQRLTPKTNPAPDSAQIAAEKAAETRRKNLTPTAAPQTGSHL